MRSTQNICTDVTRQLDDLEASLPEVPARALALGRASAHRLTETASGVARDVGRQLEQLSATASTAFATTVGQARSAVDRTSSTAVHTTKETVGQAKTQARKTATASKRASTALLDDPTRAVEPSAAGRPAALENWTKAQLYERAQELDIDGRSAMTKRQLVAAIRST